MSDIYVYQIWDTLNKQFIRSYRGRSMWLHLSSARLVMTYKMKNVLIYPPGRLEIKKYKLTKVTE